MNERLREIDERAVKLLERDVRHAQAALEHFLAACRACRAANDDLVRRTVGSLMVYDLGFKREGRAVYCPVCSRCIFSGES